MESKADRETKSGAAADETTQQLTRLTKDLQFVSESEAPLTVVTYAAPQGELTEATLLKLTGEAAGAQVETQELTYFLRNHTADDGVLGDPALANRFKALQMYLKQELTDTKVYRVGSGTQVTAYALGKTGGGQLAGFKTVLTET
jgi:histidine triad (HIT) family protein